MAQSVDPLQSFSHIVENVPQWLSSLDRLNAQCDEQYERFYRLTKTGQVKLTRKKKHDSTESLRPKNEGPRLFPDDDIQEEGFPSAHDAARSRSNKMPASPVEPGPTSPTTNNRKRKPSSALSAASGSNRYRTKSMVIVYYDSAIQDGFTDLVKNLANARSTLRKGKNAATFQDRMVTMGLPSDNSLPLQGDGSLDPKAMLASLGRARGTSSGGGPVRAGASEKQKYKAFDEADRDLEEAQNLSEKGAHQFLRDGDSRIEIEGMRKRFRMVLTLAEEEVNRLRPKGGKERSAGTDHANTASSKTGVPSITPMPTKTPKTETHVTADTTKVDRPQAPLVPSSVAPSSAPTGKQLNFAATGAIEVDDGVSDASSVKIDMNLIRRPMRRT